MTGHDPFQQAEKPRFKRAGNDEFYIWEREEYVRVTSVLGQIKGDHLLAWYGKTAALAAASPLVLAGMFSTDDYMHEELLRFVDSHAIRQLTPADAVLEACDWRSNMRAAERYRDRAADMGSVAHKFVHEYALGLREKDLLGWCIAAVVESGCLTESLLARYESFGKNERQVSEEYGRLAYQRVVRAHAVIEAFQPEFTMTGLEAVVIDLDDLYAGTMDWAARFSKGKWEKAGAEWPFAVQSAHVIGDNKFTRSCPSSVRYQMAAYARSSFIGDMTTGDSFQHEPYDGMVCWWLGGDDHLLNPTDNLHVVPKVWAGEDAIDRFAEDFRLLTAFYRSSKDLPRAAASRAYRERKAPAPRRGQRPNPIMSEATR